MTQDKEKKPFYNLFSDKRTETGKDLSEFADATKINIKYLEAIESGDFDILPNVYIRLFLRSYAEILDINAEKILEEYNTYINISNQQLKTSGVSYIKKKPKIDEKELVIKQKEKKQDKTYDEKQYSESYFLKPKKIILLLFAITGISVIYMALYYLSNEQKNRTNQVQTDSKIIKQYTKDIIFDLDNSIKLKIINNQPTKIKVSYKDSVGMLEVLCNNDDIIKEDLYKYDIDQNNVYFEINNADHISEISINNTSILNLLDKKDEQIYLIRGHINRLKNSINIFFYEQ